MVVGFREVHNTICYYRFWQPQKYSQLKLHILAIASYNMFLDDFISRVLFPTIKNMLLLYKPSVLSYNWESELNNFWGLYKENTLAYSVKDQTVKS